MNEVLLSATLITLLVYSFGVRLDMMQAISALFILVVLENNSSNDAFTDLHILL